MPVWCCGSACPGRIIPAYAGNAWRPPSRSTRRPDHPRVCGECGMEGYFVLIAFRIIPAYAGNATICARVSDGASGSSPRMRGTRFLGHLPCDVHRIIPAYAGNASRARAGSPRVSDHPRVCGERTCAASTSPQARGSSPRMRGTLGVRKVARVRARIIPAYAGNA